MRRRPYNKLILTQQQLCKLLVKSLNLIIELLPSWEIHFLALGSLSERLSNLLDNLVGNTPAGKYMFKVNS